MKVRIYGLWSYILYTHLLNNATMHTLHSTGQLFVDDCTV